MCNWRSTRRIACEPLELRRLLAANLVQNGSFENSISPPPTLTVPLGYTGITGWTVFNQPIDYISDGLWQAADGARSIDLAGTPGAGGVRQTIPTAVGDHYLLKFSLSGNPDKLFNPTLKTTRVSVAGINKSFSYDTRSPATASGT